MTRIRPLIFLLFVTPVSAGEVDGNSFYCKPFKTGMLGAAVVPFALEFREGAAQTYNLKGVPRTAVRYLADAKSVVWSFGSTKSSINRKTLLYERRSRENLLFAVSWQCEFMRISEAKLQLEAYRIAREKKERGEGN